MLIKTPIYVLNNRAIFGCENKKPAKKIVGIKRQYLHGELRNF